MAEEHANNYALALAKAAEMLGGCEPHAAAVQAGVVYRDQRQGKGEFVVAFWGRDYLVSYPQGAVRDAEAGEPPAMTVQIIILHYLVAADGCPMADRWIAFREFPGGLLYTAAFQRHVSAALAGAYGHDAAALARVGSRLGGERLGYGDASFRFRLLPRVALAVTLSVADDEFPADARVLFDAAANHYLSLEDLAGLGEWFAERLAAQAEMG